MSYFSKGHHDEGDKVDDFDEFDPTPYGGGYDITLTYGRPLHPSEITCHPKNSSTNEFDYDRPQYTSSAKPSAYSNDVLDNEYKCYTRPKPRPAQHHPESGYGGPKPQHGGDSGYGSAYGKKSEYERPNTEYGSGYAKPEYEKPSSEYGSGYGRKNESGYGGGSEYGSGNVWKPEREEYGYGKKSEYEEVQPSYGHHSSHERPSYGRSEEEDYRKPKPTYVRHDDDDDDHHGYGRKKHGDDDDEDSEDDSGDDNEKKKHRKHHQNRKHYDD